MTYKLPGWAPCEPPDATCSRRIRQLVVEAVFGVWHEQHRPADLATVYSKVRKRINTYILTAQTDQWNAKEWRVPSKRTVDRRVNEAADPRFYEQGIPKIVAVTAGVYQPNLQLMNVERVGGESE